MRLTVMPLRNGSTEGLAQVMPAGRQFRIRCSFIADAEGYRLKDRISSLGKALLVMHAPRDHVVGIEHASAIFLAAKHPKSFVSLDDADHLLSDANSAAYAAGVALRLKGVGAESTGHLPAISISFARNAASSSLSTEMTRTLEAGSAVVTRVQAGL
jgi:hypothetical protein